MAALSHFHRFCVGRTRTAAPPVHVHPRRYGDGEDSLGGFGGEEHTSSAKLGEVEGGGARVTGSDTYAQNDIDDVEVYNASQQSRW